MKYLLILLVALCSSTYTSAQTNATANPVAGATSGSREKDGLKGPIRRVRVETSNIVTRNGKQIELPKTLLEVSTYDAAGGKIDSVTYPVDSGTAPGKEEFKHDDKGNPIEMTLRGSDGSVLSQEKYTYEFDEFGNWKKMTTAIAVYENGAVSYEPTKVTYRTLTYYYGPTMPKAGAPAATASAPAAKRTDAEAAPTPAASTEKNVPTQQPPVVSSSPATAPEQSTTVATSAEANPSKAALKIPVIRIPEEVLRKAAIEIPEPQYPPTAELARASGPVQVELMIDQNGVVTTARATSGNPMLFEAATSAASKARFLMSAFSNQPTGAYSVLTYNFARPVELTTVPANASPAITDSTPPAPASNNPRVADPKTFADHFNKGMASLTAGKYKEAVDSLTQAVALNPDDAIAYTKLGLAHSALGENKPAIAAFKQAIKLNRAFVDADAYFRLGLAYLAQSDYASAIDPLKQALYGVKARQLEDRAKPIAGPTETEIHDALGRAYYGTGSYRQAVTSFETAVKLKPNFASAHYGLGLSYLEVGDKRAAEKQEKTLRKLNSRLADRLAGMLFTPAGQKNKVF